MTTLVVIPARLAAQRLPNKPLADIGGKPMIVRVWEQAVAANIGPVIVAAGDQEIVDVIKAHGGQAVLTDPSLPSGTDRVHAAAELVDPEGRFHTVVNIQGDQPTIAPEAVAAVLKPLTDDRIDIGTIAAETVDPAGFINPNTVKIAMTFAGPQATYARAWYFSRGPIPNGLDNPAQKPFYYHIGVYAYRRAALRRFVGLAPSVLENRERLEQLRALEAGMKLGVALVDQIPISIDTPADLEKVRAMVKG